MSFLDIGAMYEPVRKYTLEDASWILREAVKHLEGRIQYILPTRNEAAENLQNIRQAPWWDLTVFEWVDKLCWGSRYNRLDPLLRQLQALLVECQSAYNTGNRGMQARAFRHLARYYNHFARERSVGLLLSLPDVIIWEDYNQANALAKLLKREDDGQALAVAEPQPLKFRAWEFAKPERWWNLAAWIRYRPGANMYLVFTEAALGLLGSSVYWQLPLICHGVFVVWAFRGLAQKNP